MFRDGTRMVRAPLRKASSSVSRHKAQSLPDPSDGILQHCQTWQAAAALCWALATTCTTTGESRDIVSVSG